MIDSTSKAYLVGFRLCIAAYDFIFDTGYLTHLFEEARITIADPFFLSQYFFQILIFPVVKNSFAVHPCFAFWIFNFPSIVYEFAVVANIISDPDKYGAYFQD